MALIVQKYGGTSVGDPDRIRNVARRVVDTVKAGHRVAVVVSAMSGQTDRLVALARELGGDDPDPREYDQLVSTGEQVTIALLAMAIQRLGQPARSFTGSQMGMRTDTAHTRARIESIDTRRAAPTRSTRPGGRARGLPGHRRGRQRHDARPRRLGHLGGGGGRRAATPTSARSTPTSTASTRRIRASCRPRASSSASPTRRCSRWRASARRCSRSARCDSRCATRVPLHVRSSFNDATGTWVVPEEQVMEQLVVSGVTYNRNEAKIRVRGVHDVPGVAARRVLAARRRTASWST